MEYPAEYTLPIQGLQLGDHHYQYEVDQSFFQFFDSSPIEDGLIHLQVHLEKRIDMMIFSFEFDGRVNANCDRCLADIQLPIGGSNRLLVKYDPSDADEVDVIFLNPDASEFNVAKYAYEFICLALPLSKVYDCDEDEDPSCDFDMLEHLGFKKESNTNNPFKDALKGLEGNN